MEIFVSKDGRQQGPYTMEQLQSSLATGTFSGADLCWHQSLAEWQPISSVISAVPPPMGASGAVAQRAKTDPLSIWSLVLGILSWLCLSIIAGIPAIICGHISLGRIKSNTLLQGKGMAIAGLVLGYVSTLIIPVAILAAIALPAVVGAKEKAQAALQLSNARQIHLAMQMAALDAATAGKKGVGWPADAGLSSVAEVKQMLVAGDYLTAKQAESIGFENFLIGNVSEEDPPDTVFIKSKPVAGKPPVVFRKGGDGEIVRRGQTEIGIVPPRDPRFLE